MHLLFAPPVCASYSRIPCTTPHLLFVPPTHAYLARPRAYPEYCRYGLWLAMLVSAYAPFLDEATGKLDWMEESPY